MINWSSGRKAPADVTGHTVRPCKFISRWLHKEFVMYKVYISRRSKKKMHFAFSPPRSKNIVLFAPRKGDMSVSLIAMSLTPCMRRFILSVSPSSRGNFINKERTYFYPARAMGQNPEASLSFCPGKRETTYKNRKERF